MLTTSLRMNTYTVNNVYKAINGYSLDLQGRLPLWGIRSLKISDEGTVPWLYGGGSSGGREPSLREPSLHNVAISVFKPVCIFWLTWTLPTKGLSLRGMGLYLPV